MAEFKYKTVAAPRRVKKARGVKGAEAQLAHNIGEIIAREAVDGWEYLRADSLPIEEGGGMFSRPHVSWRAVLIFRRQVQASERATPAQEHEAHVPPESREPFMRVATSTPAAPGYQPPPVGGAER